MELLYNYQIAPGCCHRCRTTKSGKIIDLRREDPDKVLRQAVYLCEDCTTAAYMLLNTPLVLVDRQVLADKDGEITALANEITRLMDEAAAMDARWCAPSPHKAPTHERRRNPEQSAEMDCR